MTNCIITLPTTIKLDNGDFDSTYLSKSHFDKMFGRIEFAFKSFCAELIIFFFFS